MNKKKHWEKIYKTKSTDQVSWFQTNPTMSLRLISETKIAKREPLIDVGGGASNLVDFLLDDGFTDLSVLDISAGALEAAKHRLQDRADQIQWIEEDITRFNPARRYALWHDRAVFHFLTTEEDRKAYIDTLDRSLSEHGRGIIATFSLTGPQKCSGIEIVQYDKEKIESELGDRFVLYDVREETHITPAQKPQKFTYFCFKR